jgi:hypothetical protein
MQKNIFRLSLFNLRKNRREAVGIAFLTLITTFLLATFAANIAGFSDAFEISFDAADIESVREVMQRIMTAVGGVICSDTDDFQPSYTLDNLSMLQ